MSVATDTKNAEDTRRHPAAHVADWSKWRAIVELSSIATLVSFIISAAILYSVLERNGVRFSAVVSVNDIVVYGISQLLSTITWTIYMLPIGIVGYISIKYSVLVLRWTFARRSVFRFIVATVVATALSSPPIIIALIYEDRPEEDLSMWEGWPFGTDLPYFRLINDFGLLLVYASLLFFLAVYLLLVWYINFRGSEVAKESGLHLEAVHQMARMGEQILLFFLFVALCLAGYASYSKLDRDFARGIGYLPEDRRPASCAAGSVAIVTWIGETSLVVRCSQRALVIIKGSENVPVSLGLPPAR